MIDFNAVYDIHLKNLQQENQEKRYTGEGKEDWYHASSAGRCHIYQQLKSRKDIIEKPVDERTQRLFRLGDLVHGDIQEAISKWFTLNSQPGDVLLIEKEVKVPKFNVRGFLDVGYIRGTELHLYDIKTAASFKWQKTFGLQKNRDKNPSLNYELQLGTYALGLLEEFPELKTIHLHIVWYKKDNSDMKTVIIDNMYLGLAEYYWAEVNKNKDCDLIPFVDNDCPVASWECRYCDVSHACTSPKAPEYTGEETIDGTPIKKDLQRRGQT
jgi:hypothetical protein